MRICKIAYKLKVKTVNFILQPEIIGVLPTFFLAGILFKNAISVFGAEEVGPM